MGRRLMAYHNFSIYTANELGQKWRAFVIDKQSFDDAIYVLDCCDSESTKRATFIMQQQRDFLAALSDTFDQWLAAGFIREQCRGLSINGNLSMSVAIQNLMDCGEDTKCLVFGFIRQAAGDILLIPDAVMMICLAFYFQKEWI